VSGRSPSSRSRSCARSLRRPLDRVAVKSNRAVNRRWASEAIVCFDYRDIGKRASRVGRGRVVGHAGSVAAWLLPVESS